MGQKLKMGTRMNLLQICRVLRYAIGGVCRDVLRGHRLGRMFLLFLVLLRGALTCFLCQLQMMSSSRLIQQLEEQSRYRARQSSLLGNILEGSEREGRGKQFVWGLKKERQLGDCAYWVRWRVKITGGHEAWKSACLNYQDMVTAIEPSMEQALTQQWVPRGSFLSLYLSTLFPCLGFLTEQYEG